MTRGTYWRCVACGFACDKDNVCPDCGYHTLVQEDFPQRTWVGLRDAQKIAIVRDCSHLDTLHLIELVETELMENNK